MEKKNHRLKAALGVTIFALVAMLIVIFAKASKVEKIVWEPRGERILSGSFIQPYLIENLTEENWNNELDYMQAVDMPVLIIQWTADTQNMTTTYPTSLDGFAQSSQIDVVERALSKADEKGMKVHLGLQTNGDWFNKYTKDEGWLKQEAEYSVMFADELWERYGHHESLSGWYLSFELDNVNHPKQKNWKMIVDYYNAVTPALREKNAEMTLSIAPFFNTSLGMSPSKWQKMWEYILSESDIDILALQDGVGAGNANQEKIASWFEATAKACIASEKTKLWADTETFTPSFEPVEIDQVIASMEEAAPYVDGFVSFSFSHYISPNSVDKHYYADYFEYVENLK